MFSTEGSGSGLKKTLIRIRIRIRFLLRVWIRIRSISDRPDQSTLLSTTLSVRLNLMYKKNEAKFAFSFYFPSLFFLDCYRFFFDLTFLVKNLFSSFSGRRRVFFLFYFLVFFYKFPPQLLLST